jgi:hypothetical protein
MGQWRYITIIIDLGTRWKWVASFTFRQLYSRGKSPRNRLGRRLGGPKIRSGLFGEEKYLAPAGNRKENQSRKSQGQSEQIPSNPRQLGRNLTWNFAPIENPSRKDYKQKFSCWYDGRCCENIARISNPQLPVTLYWHFL